MKYSFQTKFAFNQNVLSRHNISILLYFVPTQYCVGLVFHGQIWTDCIGYKDKKKNKI